MEEKDILALRELLREPKLGVSFWVKLLLPAVLPVVIAMGGWAYTLAKVPTQKDVTTMIQNDAPWRRHEEKVLFIVENYEKERAEHRVAIETLRLEIATLKAKQ